MGNGWWFSLQCERCLYQCSFGVCMQIFQPSCLLYQITPLQADQLISFVPLIHTVLFLYSFDAQAMVFLSGSWVIQSCSLPLICFWCVGSSNGRETIEQCCGWGLVLSRAMHMEECSPSGKGVAWHMLCHAPKEMQCKSSTYFCPWCYCSKLKSAHPALL